MFLNERDNYQVKVGSLLLCFQDDIVDDVGDFVAAAEILKERGAYKIYIMATHGLLSADAPRLIEESAIDVVSTDENRVLLVTHVWLVGADLQSLPDLVLT